MTVATSNPLRRRAAGLRTGLICLLFAGCGSAMSYLAGPLPVGARHAPEVELLGVDADGAPVAREGDLSARMTPVRSVPGTAPEHALRLFLDDADGARWVLVVRTWAPLVLDVTPGQAIDLALRRGEGVSLVLSDARGALFSLVSGASVPADQRRMPVQVYATQDRVALEVSSGDDLCNRTWAHQLVEVAAGGHEWLLAPGRAAVVAAAGDEYRIAIAASRIPEEADCGVLGERELAYHWSRMPRLAAANTR